MSDYSDTEYRIFGLSRKTGLFLIGGDSLETRQNIGSAWQGAATPKTKSAGLSCRHSLVGSGIKFLRLNASLVARQQDLRIRNRGTGTSANRRSTQHSLSLLPENAKRNS